jgi:hypothetical protein
MFVCVKWCQTHIVLCSCFVFLRLVYHILPVSLEFPILIVPSVFSNVYFQQDLAQFGFGEIKITSLLYK